MLIFVFTGDSVGIKMYPIYLSCFRLVVNAVYVRVSLSFCGSLHVNLTCSQIKMESWLRKCMLIMFGDIFLQDICCLCSWAVGAVCAKQCIIGAVGSKPCTIGAVGAKLCRSLLSVHLVKY